MYEARHTRRTRTNIAVLSCSTAALERGVRRLSGVSDAAGGAYEYHGWRDVPSRPLSLPSEDLPSASSLGSSFSRTMKLSLSAPGFSSSLSAGRLERMASRIRLSSCSRSAISPTLVPVGSLSAQLG